MAHECIHGFEAGLCDVCYPAAPPPRPARTATTAPARSRSSAPAVKTQRDSRVYLVMGLAELEHVIADGEIDGEPRWQTEANASRRDDAVLVTSVSALGAGTVTVGDEVIAPGAVPLSAVHAVGVASEPVRDRVRGLLRGLDAAPRILVYPPWFMPV